ncbi:MAG: pseudouridine synthase [Nanoarchaeota archaeon]|nr:pseudouridine synthase [Nanoarchaeota archaeon]
MKGLDTNLKNSLFCVGRLDEDTSGLIIITNDGTLGSKITRPESMIEKGYAAVLEKDIKDKDIEKIKKGVTISLEHNKKVTEYKTRPCKIQLIDKRDVIITVSEGKKREVRRIFEAVGNKVVSLERVSIGSLRLDGIRTGEFKFVDKEFIEKRINASSGI